ncbi:MAG: CsgG/HfaB family protein, partial [Verrucomicrobiota bacterium]
LILTGCAAVPPASVPVETSASLNFRPQAISKLVVLVQTNNNNRQNEVHGFDRTIEDEFIPVLLRKGYTLASRSDVDSITKEMRFQNSGMTDKDAAEVGKMLNVSAVLVVGVTELNTEEGYYGTPGSYYGRYYFTSGALGVRLISVEKGEILWFGKHSTALRSDLNNMGMTILKSLARKIAEAFPERSPEKAQ